MSNFSKFLNENQDALSQEGNIGLMMDKSEHQEDRGIVEELANFDAAQAFRDFLMNPDYLTGKMVWGDYENTTVLSHKDFAVKHGGFPKTSFLIAAPHEHEFEAHGIPPHFVLLMVKNYQQQDFYQERSSDWVKKLGDLSSDKWFLKPEEKENNKSLKTIETFLSLIPLRCHVQGMFYQTADNTFDFSAQVDLMLPAYCYQIRKPNNNMLNIIFNHKSFVRAKQLAQSQEYGKMQTCRIGTFRETESQTFIKGDYPPIYLPLKVFVSRRTALFTKTRYGKSNTMKQIMSCFLKENLKDNGLNKTSLLIFDENGEYANINTQDNTSLLEKFGKRQFSCQNQTPENLLRSYTLNGRTKGNLMLNFYLNPQETMSALGKLLRKGETRSIYADNFALSDVINIADEGELPNVPRGNMLTAVQLLWTVLYKAGFAYEHKRNSPFFDKFKATEWFEPEQLIKDTVMALEDPQLSQLVQSVEKTPAGAFSRMVRIMEAFGECYWVEKSLKKEDVRRLASVEGILSMLDTSNKAGYKLLRKFKEYHSAAADNRSVTVLDDICEKGVSVIVDLSSITNYAVKRFYAERLAQKVFARAIDNFTRNLTKEKPNILIFFEEAHNLFPKGTHEESIYFKLAREAAKLNIGMVYATQSPSNIYDELLSQTENFFIGHLSAPKELSALNSLNYAFADLGMDILSNRKVGYMRVFTENNHFTMPVQIDKFE